MRLEFGVRRRKLLRQFNYEMFALHPSRFIFLRRQIIFMCLGNWYQTISHEQISWDIYANSFIAKTFFREQREKKTFFSLWFFCSLRAISCCLHEWFPHCEECFRSNSITNEIADDCRLWMSLCNISFYLQKIWKERISEKNYFSAICFKHFKLLEIALRILICFTQVTWYHLSLILNLIFCHSSEKKSSFYSRRASIAAVSKINRHAHHVKKQPQSSLFSRSIIYCRSVNSSRNSFPDRLIFITAIAQTNGIFAWLNYDHVRRRMAIDSVSNSLDGMSKSFASLSVSICFSIEFNWV